MRECGFFGVFGPIFTADSLLEREHQGDRIGGGFAGIPVKDGADDFKRPARRDAVHTLLITGRFAVFSHRFGARIGVFEVFPVVDPHFDVQRRILRDDQSTDDGELGEDVERARCAGRIFERRIGQHLAVNRDLFIDTQTIGHLDDVDPIQKGLVGLVVPKAEPFGFIRVGEDHALKRHCGEALRAFEVFLLGRRQ